MPDDDELSKLKKEVSELKQKIDPPPRQPSTHPRLNEYAPISNASNDRRCA
jgi:hypothetical protein